MGSLAVLPLTLPGHAGSGFDATGPGSEWQGGDLDGGAAETGIELVELLHEGAGLGTDEFGGFLEQAELGLTDGFEAVEDDAGFGVGVAGLPEAAQKSIDIADQVEGAAGGGGQGELRGAGMSGRPKVRVQAMLWRLRVPLELSSGLEGSWCSRASFAPLASRRHQAVGEKMALRMPGRRRRCSRFVWAVRRTAGQ